jgi:hypothetical protein
MSIQALMRHTLLLLLLAGGALTVLAQTQTQTSPIGVGNEDMPWFREYPDK